MMELLRALEGLLEAHAPETLMALFGAATSMLLFVLVGIVLRHLFGLQLRAATQEAHHRNRYPVYRQYSSG